MSLLDNLAASGRGVVRIDPNCTVCGAPVAVYGIQGKGRPLDTFPEGYFCHGHAIRVKHTCSKACTDTDEGADAHEAWMLQGTVQLTVAAS